MKDIDVTDEALLDASPAEVFAAVADEATGRSGWWRPTLELYPRPGAPAGQVGSVFDIRIPGRRPIRFTERIVELVENEHVRLHYIGGDFRGEGLWSFEPVDGRTRVRFRFHVRPHGLAMRLASHLTDIGRLHSQVAQRGFEGLRRYLQAQRMAGTPPPSAPPMEVRAPH